jgi:hypothetical protein
MVYALAVAQAQAGTPIQLLLLRLGPTHIPRLRQAQGDLTACLLGH